MSQDRTLIDHYQRPSLAADVEASLRALGKDPANITINDLEHIDEFHMGGRPATNALLEACAFTAGMRILDVGSGFGGPARVAAAARNITVQGIDLTPDFVAIANDLSRRVGLASRTEFIVGSALAMPFDEASFDGATMIHVGMNIADKAQLMRAVRNCLKPGACFAIYDIMRVGDGDLEFPLPWSSTPETSAVAAPEDYRAALEAAGFSVEQSRDRRPLLREIAATAGGLATLPALPHRGLDWETKVANLTRMVKAGRVAPTEILARAA